MPRSQGTLSERRKAILERTQKLTHRQERCACICTCVGHIKTLDKSNPSSYTEAQYKKFIP